MSNKSFLEISLYLVSKNSEDDSELASQLWKSLQQFAPETEEERHQRRIDLSHALSVSIRCDDWEKSYDYLKDASCDVSHVAQVLRGIAQSDSVDLKRLSALYKESRPIIFRSNDASVTKDVFFTIDLMLDVCSLGGDASLLPTIVSDLLGREESSHPTIQITNKLYSRLVRLCIENNLPQCVFALYTWPDESFHSMIRVFRMMERYFRALKSSDPSMMEWKQQVLQLHYSNPTSEESPVEDSVEEEFIEPSVLEVLKDYKPERENAKKGRLESSRSRGKGSDATRRSRSGVMKRRDGAKFSGDREGGEGRMRRESRSSKDNRVVNSDRMSRDRASKDRAPRGDRFSRSESPARSNPKRENRPSTDHSSGRSRRNASRERRFS